jgi:hypothetical protein
VPSDQIVAGFEVPGRSVNTRWVADRLCDALRSEPRITLRTGVTVTRVVPQKTVSGAWEVTADALAEDPFDLVVNALWAYARFREIR